MRETPLEENWNWTDSYCPCPCLVEDDPMEKQTGCDVPCRDEPLRNSMNESYHLSIRYRVMVYY